MRKRLTMVWNCADWHRKVRTAGSASTKSMANPSIPSAANWEQVSYGPQLCPYLIWWKERGRRVFHLHASNVQTNTLTTTWYRGIVQFE